MALLGLLPRPAASMALCAGAGSLATWSIRPTRKSCGSLEGSRRGLLSRVLGRYSRTVRGPRSDAVRRAGRPVFLDPSRRSAVGGLGLRALATHWRPISKGLILAQNERWRRGLGMQ